MKRISKGNETLVIGTAQEKELQEPLSFESHASAEHCLRSYLTDPYNIAILRKILYESSLNCTVCSLSDLEVVSQVAQMVVQGQVVVALEKPLAVAGGSRGAKEETKQTEGNTFDRNKHISESTVVGSSLAAGILMIRTIRLLCEKKAVKGAQVTIINNNMTLQTDSNGYVTFRGLKRQTYNVKIEMYNFKTETISVEANTSSDCNEIELKPEWDITMIPDIMRKQGKDWDVGAQLMELWFSKKAYTYPDPKDVNHLHVPHNEDIVTIEWALKFSRVKKVYDEMWNNKIYANSAAKELIEKSIKKNGLFNKKRQTKFGDLSKSVAEINSNEEGFYIQQRGVSWPIPPELDAMVAALARFNFRMAVQGHVTYKETRSTYWGLGDDEDVYTVKINKVGIYVRDSYDFTGEQPFGLGLGNWNPDINKVAIFAFSGSHEVTNRTFRKWRDKAGCGGDYIVFSDIEVRNVDESWEIAI